jgi:hypothetical protein
VGGEEGVELGYTMCPSSGNNNWTCWPTVCISVSRCIWGELRCHASCKEGRLSDGPLAAYGQLGDWTFWAVGAHCRLEWDERVEDNEAARASCMRAGRM